MSPPNGVRLSDDIIRTLIAQAIKDEHVWARLEFDKEEAARQRFEVEVRTQYVSKDSLTERLKTSERVMDDFRKILDRYENGFWWLERIIVGSFLTALARIVYVGMK